MNRFRLRTLFIVIAIAAIGAWVLSEFMQTQPPTQSRYSAANLRELLAAGKTVVVTIDADWAVNATNRPRFMSPEVSRRIREMEIETLSADWTNGDSQVGDLMKRVGETNVPAMIVFSPDAPDHPVVLAKDPAEADILNVLNRKANR